MQTDKELARHLLSLQSAPLDARTDEWLEQLLLAENEVCARADIPLNETEQGLTPYAVSEINAWVGARV